MKVVYNFWFCCTVLCVLVAAPIPREAKAQDTPNLLITQEEYGAFSTYELLEYTVDGDEEGSAATIEYDEDYCDLPIPLTLCLISQHARDVVYVSSEVTAIYNGTTAPTLTILDNSGDTNATYHYTHEDWNVESNLVYGGLAKYNDYIFAADIGLEDEEGDKGIIRFDISDDYSSERFIDDESFFEVNVGQDGYLYALVYIPPDFGSVFASSHGATTFKKYDPETMEFVEEFTFTDDNDDEFEVRAIAVNADGEIFATAAEGMVYKYAKNDDGEYQQVASIELLEDSDDYELANNSIGDIDVASDGTIALGNIDGDVVILDESLDEVIRTFSVGERTVFLTFAESFDYFLRGDCNTSEAVDISDAIFLLKHLYLGEGEPENEDACDVNDDGELSITDATDLLATLFQGEAKIESPYPKAGIDRTGDSLNE